MFILKSTKWSDTHSKSVGIGAQGHDVVETVGCGTILTGCDQADKSNHNDQDQQKKQFILYSIIKHLRKIYQCNKENKI